MSPQVLFGDARVLVVKALAEHYREKFPRYRLVARQVGRDAGDSWVVFLGLVDSSGVESQLVGSPALVVSKADGQLSLAQIPPRFDILDMPLVEAEGHSLNG